MVGHGTFEKEQKHFVGILHFRAVHHSHQYSLLPRVGFSKFFFRLTKLEFVWRFYSWNSGGPEWMFSRPSLKKIVRLGWKIEFTRKEYKIYDKTLSKQDICRCTQKLFSVNENPFFGNHVCAQAESFWLHKKSCQYLEEIQYCNSHEIVSISCTNNAQGKFGKAIS